MLWKPRGLRCQRLSGISLVAVTFGLIRAFLFGHVVVKVIGTL